jgi:DNA-directed RNA polymerase subunit M/transcription elongation factor TFIIS
MIKFKSCPRCRGDLYLGEDIFGKYLSCLQCGYLRDVVRENVVEPEPVTHIVDCKAA